MSDDGDIARQRRVAQGALVDLLAAMDAAHICPAVLVAEMGRCLACAIHSAADTHVGRASLLGGVTDMMQHFALKDGPSGGSVH